MTGYQVTGDDLVALWQLISDQLRVEVPESTYDTWLASLQPVALRGDELVVLAPVEIRAWVAERFSRVLARAAEVVLEAPVRVRVIDDARSEVWVGNVTPTDHAQIRVPMHYLLHWPVERDPHARTNWRGSDLRRWEHVGADVECDHVSSPLHARVMIAVAGCLQGGIGADRRVVVSPHELLRAGGLRRPGGRDVRDLLRVLEDWNASRTLRATLRVPARARGAWGPQRPTVVIDGPPARGSVVTVDGEVLDPAAARSRRIAASAIVGIVLDVDARFAQLVAEEGGCQLVSRATLQLLSTRELVPYMRHQSLAPKAGKETRQRYTGWPWLQQLGLHGRIDPVLEDDVDAEVAGAARRTRQKAQRRMEQDLRDDLLKLCELDRGYTWVRMTDGGNGCSVVRVGVGSDPATGRRVYGPRPSAEEARKFARRAWRRELVRRGQCDPTARTFTSFARTRARRRPPHADVVAAAWRAPRRNAPQVFSQVRAHGPPTVP